MPTFGLLTEPWIPVVGLDGATAEVGLRQALQQAPRLREIRDPIPTVEFGLYRLLVALVMDIHELKLLADLEELLAAGEFDDAKVEAYFARWADRFDLFHSKHPFLQTAGLQGKEKPLAALLPLVPSGTSALHFHHQYEASFSASPAAAARLLSAMAPFMTSGGRTFSPSINGAPPWYVLISGSTLFETLCLNCCALPLSQARGSAPPAWRNDKPIAGSRATQASLLEALTWRPRRIQLVPGDGGHCAVGGSTASCLIRTMHFDPGASCDFTWADPNVAYRIADKVKPLRPREGHQLWRDTGPLALLRERDYEVERGRTKVRFERPALVTQFAELVRQGILTDRAELRLVAYAMRTDLKMKVFEWQREELSLPAALIWRSNFRSDAQRAMEEAESVAHSLSRAVKMAYPREGQGNKSAFEARIASAERRFWTDLRPHYEEFLRGLAGLPEDAQEPATEQCLERWRAQLHQVGRQALDEAIGDLDTDADALVRQVNARSFFHRRLRGILSADSAQDSVGQKSPTRRAKGGGKR